MGYLVRGPAYGAFSSQVIVGNGSTNFYSLDYVAPSVSAILVVINGVVKEPIIDYSLINGGTMISFTAPVANGARAVITFLGRSLTVPVPVGNEIIKSHFTGNGVTTLYPVTGNPVLDSQLMIFVDGVQQSVGAGKNCSYSSGNVTFSEAPTLGAEIDFYVLGRERVVTDVPADHSITRTKLANDIRGQVAAWLVANTNTSCAVGNNYFVDTLGGSRTMTLPSVAAVGDKMEFVDYAGTFATNNCVVSRNGHLINGAASDLTLSTNGQSVTLTYSGATYGWRVK